MAHETIIVTSCKTCPFSESEKKPFSASCFAPVQIHQGKYKIDSYYKNNKSPKWCPLKNTSLKIDFKKQIKKKESVAIDSKPWLRDHPKYQDYPKHQNDCSHTNTTKLLSSMKVCNDCGKQII